MRTMFGTDYLNIRAWDLSFIRRGRYGQLVWGQGAMPNVGSDTDYNIAIGVEALRDAVTTYATVAIGYHAGAGQAYGRTGVYVGHVAGEFVSGDPVGGSSNTFVGGYCGRGVEDNPMTGGDNTGMGEACLIRIQGDSFFNCAYGFNCMYGFETGIGNSAYGNSAGFALTNSNGNSLFGLNAYQWGDGEYNVMIGYTAGEGTTFQKTSNASTANGDNKIYFASTADLAIGMMVYRSGVLNPGSFITAVFPTYVEVSVPTYNAASSGLAYTIVPDQHDGSRNVFIGYVAGNSIQGALDDTVGVGYGALRSLTTGTGNLAVGAYAGHSVTTEADNCFIGYRAGRYVTSPDNTFVGSSAGRGILATPLTGAGNTGIGQDAFADIQGGAVRNTGIGASVALNLTTGSYNVIVGANNAAVLTTGSQNIIIGYDLEVAAAGTSNTLNIGGILTATGTYSSTQPAFEFLGSITLREETDPAAPAANKGTVYVRDNGAGKTQLCVRFPTGAVQVIATEP